MKLKERAMFRSVVVQRMRFGFFTTIVSYASLYSILSIENTPLLSSPWGMSFEWKLWQGEGWWKLILIALFLLSSTLTANTSLTEGKDVRQLYPKPTQKQPEVYIPRHIPAELIVEVTLRLVKKMEVEVAGIYVGENPVPNAFTTFAFERGNVVFLHSNLLDILDEQSIEAVIAHELGHIKNNDVWYQLAAVLPRRIIGLWGLMILVQIFGVMLLSEEVGIFFRRMLLFIGGISLLVNCDNFLKALGRSYAQTKEKMADAYAVEYTSLEGMVNGFLRLNDRSHTLKSFIRALEKEDTDINSEVLNEALQIFPTGNKSQESIEKNASRYYAQAQFNIFLKRLRIELPEAKSSELLEEFLSYQKEKKKSKEEEAEELQEPFVWRDFDWNHDGVLQREEILAMCQALQKDKEALTSAEDKEGDHPPVRERVLFLAELFQDKLQKT